MSTNDLPLLPMSELSAHFSQNSMRRGEGYSVGGRVDLQPGSPGTIRALVAGGGGKRYTVELEAAALLEGELEGWCSCPAQRSWGSCKHQYAVLLELDGLMMMGAGDDAWPVQETEGSRRRVYGERTARLEQLRRMRAGAGGRRVELHVQVAESREHLTLAVALRAAAEGTLGGWIPLDLTRRGQLDERSQRVMEFLLPQAKLQQLSAGRFGHRRPMGPTAQLDGGLLSTIAGFCGEGGLLFVEGAPLEVEEEVLRLEVRRESESGGRVELRGVIEGAGGLRFDLHADESGEEERVLVITAGGWVATTRRLGRLGESCDVALGIELLHGGPMALPDLELETLLPLVDPGKDSLQVEELPEVEAGQPAGRLSVSFPEHFASHGGALLPGQIEFGYGEGWVRPGDPVRPIASGDRLIGRDVAAEARLLREVEALDVRVAADEHPTPFVEHSNDLRMRFGQLEEVVRALCASGWDVRANDQPYVSSGGSSVKVKSGADWFGLEGGVDFDGTVVPLPELLAAARRSERTVQLGDGRIGLLPEEWLAKWGWTELGEAQEDGSVRFPRRQGWLLDALLAEREGVQSDRRFATFSKSLRAFDGVTARKPARGFHGELRPYQEEGLGWFEYLSKLGFGGCLADDMGLGKTVQVLALLEGRRTRRLRKGEQRRPSLVVAPASVVHNWIAEAGRFTPRLNAHEHHGADRWKRFEEASGPQLIVTTYALLRRDAERLGEMEFDYAILDEAQAIKNATSQAAKAARLLRAEHRLALSGTPIENRLEELWSLFEFLNPGMLGAAPAFKRLLKGGADESRLPQIARAVRPFVLRRTKQEVLPELPPKTEQTVAIDLPAGQRKVYDELAAYYRKALAGAEVEEQNSIQILTALLRLRQAACHPGLIDAERAGAASGKFDELLPRLEELVAEGHKALVFSQFTQLLDLLRARLDAKGLNYELLTGRTRNRAACVESFQSEEGPSLFLISLKAGGTGLNLTAADYVFLLDPWWNPAAEAQAIDRAHRMGRTRPVHAYRLVARDTIEERVLELQESKRQLAASILEPATGSVADLTQGDLQHLLG